MIATPDQEVKIQYRQHHVEHLKREVFKIFLVLVNGVHK